MIRQLLSPAFVKFPSPAQARPYWHPARPAAPARTALWIDPAPQARHGRRYVSRCSGIIPHALAQPWRRCGFVALSSTIRNAQPVEVYNGGCAGEPRGARSDRFARRAKRAAATDLAFNLNLSAHHLDKARGNVRPRPSHSDASSSCPPARTLENGLLLFRRDADARTAISTRSPLLRVRLLKAHGDDHLATSVNLIALPMS